MKYEKKDKGNVIISTVYDDQTGQEKVEKISLKEGSNEQNKDIVESYIISSSKRGFSVYEERILLRTIECFQYQLENKKLNKDFSITPDLRGDVMITLPISSLLLNGDKNYSRIKNAFLSLMHKEVIYSNDKEWEAISLISRAKISKYEHNIKFNLHHEIYEALLNFSKGYRKYELKTAMTFKSVYSMRFYELFSEKHDSITYGIDNLKSIFQLENKYKQIRQFINYVIEPAKKELSLKASFSFTYEFQYEKDSINKKKGRKKITGITFTPVHYSTKRNRISSVKDTSKNIVLSDILLSEEIKAFFSLGFSEQELKTKYYELLHDINQARKQGKIIITCSIIEYAQKAKNPKVYLKRVLRKEIKQWKEALLSKQLSGLIDLKDKSNVNYKKEESSVYSFLKNHLCFSGEELEKVMIYVMNKGGGEYFNNLLHSFDSDNEKIKEQIMSEMYKLSSNQLSNTFAKSETKLELSKLKNVHNMNESSSFYSYEPISSLINTSTSSLSSKEQSLSIRKLKKNWKKIVLKRISFKGKIGYIMRFGSKNYLKNKADKIGLEIYSNKKSKF